MALETLTAFAPAILGAVGSIGSSLINSNQSARNVAQQQAAAMATNEQQFQYGRVNADIAWDRDLAMHNWTVAENRQNAEWAYDKQVALLGRAQDFSREQTAEQERYNTQMANSVYQRGVNDMRAAGINPMLAIMKGGDPAASVSPMPASASGVAQASPGSSVSADMPSVSSVAPAQRQLAPFGNFIASAFEAMQMSQQMEAIAANIEKTQSDTDVSKATAGLTRQQEAFAAANTAQKWAEYVETHPSAEARRTAEYAAAEASRAAAALSGAQAAESASRKEATDLETSIKRDTAGGHTAREGLGLAALIRRIMNDAGGSTPPGIPGTGGPPGRRFGAPANLPIPPSLSSKAGAAAAAIPSLVLPGGGARPGNYGGNPY